MHTYNFYITNYLQQLHHIIEKQNTRLNQLEQQITSLQREIEELKSKPSTNIERIEYKFDQLKVETLEGTLNIGLNPLNGEQIEDFSVSNAKMNIPDIRHVHKDLIDEIETEINEFLLNDCKKYITNIEREERFALVEGYQDFIINDISKQINDRIIYYISQHEADLQNPLRVASIRQIIVGKIKEDIKNSIQGFMKNIPDNMKDVKEE